MRLNIKTQIKLSKEFLKVAKNGKNLLAFSHGVDSTALFYLLYLNGVEFDLAIVDYGLRKESKDEVAAARALANEFNKRIFVKEVSLSGGDFENRARAVRYAFFAELILDHGYANLITAHQLNDRFEWLLMRLGRGAGLAEVLGMSEVGEFVVAKNEPIKQARQNNSLWKNPEKIHLLRPLLNVNRNEILDFLHTNALRYFTDTSNNDFKFERNRIRGKFASEFISCFGAGVARSFRLLEHDAKSLKPEIKQLGQNVIAVKADANAMRGISLALKRFGIVLSAKQRDELDHEGKLKSGVVGGKVAVGVGERELGGWVLITPYLNPQNKTDANQQTILKTNPKNFKTQGYDFKKEQDKMSKEFKEKCRVVGVSPLNRAFLYKMQIDPQNLLSVIKHP